MLLLASLGYAYPSAWCPNVSPAWTQLLKEEEYAKFLFLSNLFIYS